MKKIVSPKTNTIIEIISALFILLFMYTAITKSFQIDSTIEALKKTPVLSSFAEQTAWALVISEFIVAGLLFLPKTRTIGLHSSLALMMAFTAYIILMMIFAPKLPCTCGGVISKMSWTQHLIFNIFLCLLATTGIILQRKSLKSSVEENESAPIVFT